MMGIKLLILLLPYALAVSPNANEVISAVHSGSLTYMTEHHTEILSILTREICDGGAFLHQAVRNSQREIVGKCARLGANMNGVSDQVSKLTPLHIAAFTGDADMVSILIGAGASINVVDSSGISPAMSACRAGHDTVTESLLKLDADVSAADNYGSSIVHCIIQNRLEKSIDLILSPWFKQPLPLFQRDVLGYYPAAYAMSKGYMNIAEELFRRMFETMVDEKSGKDELLVNAVRSNWPTVVWMILSKFRGNVNAQDECGNTLLHYAVRWNLPVMVRTLMPFNPDTTIENNAGETVLQLYNAMRFPFLRPQGRRPGSDNSS